MLDGRKNRIPSSLEATIVGIVHPMALNSTVHLFKRSHTTKQLIEFFRHPQIRVSAIRGIFPSHNIERSTGPKKSHTILKKNAL